MARKQSVKRKIDGVHRFDKKPLRVWLDRDQWAKLQCVMEASGMPMDEIAEIGAERYAHHLAAYYIGDRYAQGQDVEELIYRFGLPPCGIPRSFAVRHRHYQKMELRRAKEGGQS